MENFYDVGAGGNAHILSLEAGLVSPGTFLFANDSHTSNNGAIGAMGMRTGTEIVTVLATGTLWTEVPFSLRVTLSGRLQKGVYARDLG